MNQKNTLLIVAVILLIAAGVVWTGLTLWRYTRPWPAGIVSAWSGKNDGHDRVGRHNATLVNVTLTDSPTGKAFHLNGTDSYVEIPDAPDLKPSSLTVEAWVKFDALASPNANLPGQQAIVFKLNSRDPHAGNFTGYNLNKTGNHFEFVIGSAEGQYSSANSKTSPKVGVWYHVAGTFDGDSGEIKIYVNGVLDGRGHAGFPLDCGTRPLFIGQTGEWYDCKLEGDVNNVAIYNRALPAAAILSRYHSGGH